MLEIFSKNYRVRRNMIQSRLTQECGEDLSKQEVDKVLKVQLLCVIRPLSQVEAASVFLKSSFWLPPQPGGLCN